MTIRRFFRHRMAVFGVFLLTGIVIFVVGGAFFFTETHANEPTFQRFAPPSSEYPFGTDQVGRDVLARAIYGGQISLMIAVTSITISIILGALIGLVSGYFGGWVDSILMRIVDALLAFPTLILLLTLSRALAGNTATVHFFGRQLSASVISLVLIIGLTSWMSLARIVRALVLSLKEREFVLAARIVGATNTRIIARHILPNCLAPIIVTATLGVGAAIVIESSLSFLGFGVMPPTATWGNIIERSRDMFDQAWWLWAIPGSLTILTVLAINFIGDGLRDALDPTTNK
jgi:peptide/nickel transport system permease protein